jgi:hypothetical protein
LSGISKMEMRVIHFAKPTSPLLASAKPITIFLTLLYILECSALLVAMGVYKKGERSVLVFLSTPFGFSSVITPVMLVTSMLVIVHSGPKHPPEMRAIRIFVQ